MGERKSRIKNSAEWKEVTVVHILLGITKHMRIWPISVTMVSLTNERPYLSHRRFSNGRGRSCWRRGWWRRGNLRMTWWRPARQPPSGTTGGRLSSRRRRRRQHRIAPTYQGPETTIGGVYVLMLQAWLVSLPMFTCAPSMTLCIVAKVTTTYSGWYYEEIAQRSIRIHLFLPPLSSSTRL